MRGPSDGLHGWSEDGPCDVFFFVFSFLFSFFVLVLLEYISIFFYFYVLLRCRLPFKR
jgi:hypothetical protein